MEVKFAVAAANFGDLTFTLTSSRLLQEFEMEVKFAAATNFADFYF